MMPFIFDPAMIPRGIIVGLVVAAPIGPVNLICIHKTLQSGRLHGLAAGSGSAIADAIFALIAAFGLVSVMDRVAGLGEWPQAAAALFLLGFGAWILRDNPKTADSAADSAVDRNSHAGLIATAATTFMITLSNPATILGFFAIFGGFIGLGGADLEYADAAVLVVSVFAGSLLWWTGLSFLANTFRQGMTRARLLFIQRLSGIVIAGFGVLVLVKLLLRL